MSGNDHTLENMLGELIDDADGDAVDLREILKIFGDRALGPVCAIFGVVTVVPPVGAIPALPAAIGCVILLFSAQFLFGRSHIWLPGFLSGMSIDKAKLESALDKFRPFVKRADGLLHARLTWATSAPARTAAIAVVCVMALVMIPLELVPFAVALPGLTITFVGVALIFRDGVLMGAAFLAALLSVAAPFLLL